MTPTFVISSGEAVIASKLVRRQHMVSFALGPDPTCRICGITWPDAQAYLAGFRTACTGYPEGFRTACTGYPEGFRTACTGYPESPRA